MLRYEAVLGSGIAEMLDDVASLRIELFRHYPYLYDDDLGYEKNYLKGLSENEESFVVAAYRDDEVVGAATALPLLSSAEILNGVREHFSRAGFSPSTCYYYSEILVRPAQRYHGIAKEFYRRRDETAIRLGYSTVCFAALNAEEIRSPRPSDYFDPSDMWRRMGFVQHRDIYVDHRWPTLQPDGTTLEMKHRLYFWIRHLETDD